MGSAIAAPVELFFDDFELETEGPNRVPTKWTVQRGAVEIIGPGYFGPPAFDICAESTHCVDLDGSTGFAGLMVSRDTFVLTAGATFTLTFDYSENGYGGGPVNTVTYGVGGFTDTVSTTTPAPLGDYFEATLTFTGDGSVGSIFFDHEGGDFFGLSVDNIRLTGDFGGGSPVPVPAAAFLMAPAALLVRRRKK